MFRELNRFSQTCFSWKGQVLFVSFVSFGGLEFPCMALVIVMHERGAATCTQALCLCLCIVYKSTYSSYTEVIKDGFAIFSLSCLYTWGLFMFSLCNGHNCNHYLEACIGKGSQWRKHRAWFLIKAWYCESGSRYYRFV